MSPRTNPARQVTVSIVTIFQGSLLKTGRYFLLTCFLTIKNKYIQYCELLIIKMKKKLFPVSLSSVRPVYLHKMKYMVFVSVQHVFCNGMLVFLFLHIVS